MHQTFYFRQQEVVLVLGGRQVASGQQDHRLPGTPLRPCRLTSPVDYKKTKRINLPIDFFTNKNCEKVLDH